MQTLAHQQYSHGITCIDTGLGRPGLAACYLMEQDGHAAIIETGIASTVPRILDLLANKGYQPEQVDFVIITHVHLDHAGGVGGLMQALPNAHLVVHPRGARHMIDPSKLQAGAMAVYGEEAYRTTYGELIAVPEQRIIIADDECELLFNGRLLRFYDTPGHARHHFCVFDETSRGIFTGDTLGIVYKELCADGEYFVMPSTTPVQFEPEVLKKSIDRLYALQPDYFFLTHYGRVPATDDHVAQMHKHIDNYVKLAQQSRQAANRQQELTANLIAYTLAELANYDSPMSNEQRQQLIAMDMSINAQGLEVWLGK